MLQLQSIDLSAVAINSGFTGPVHVSLSLIGDSMYCTETTLNTFGILAVERLSLMLQDIASQLTKFPAGTQTARLTHFRIPPSGSSEEALGLDIKAIVTSGEEGKYLLLAKADELELSELIAA
ncbi:MAG: hypothetical protein ACTH5D_05075 [Halomonas sp.]|uniref:hypothetical protein n=1 Tax=Halomonas sp. TaxID=1486246 RepID=UPI003F8E95B4